MPNKNDKRNYANGNEYPRWITEAGGMKFFKNI